MEKLLSFLARLKAHGIFFRLSAPTDGAVMVEIAVPGERWEVEFFEDGEVAVEVFVTCITIESEGKLQELFARFGE